MLELTGVIPAIPFFSFLLLAVFGPRMARRAVSVLGVGSVAASTVISGIVTAAFISAPPAGWSYHEVIWRWMSVSSFQADIGFYLDALSAVMVLVITFVAFLIHLYSTEYMEGDEGYSRFFAYMNLFVASMVTLVLADNLLLLYLGWEGVGLCSYLLIGFWYTDPVNGRAARKAFIVTRVGDTSMVIGLFLIFQRLGTLNIQELMHRASEQWPVGAAVAIAAAALLLGGAVGKSAQLPLQTWLPDAMAGPTPTSALIHAATMVTAGVYLIARTHVLFSLAPPVMLAVAVIGAATLLLAGCSALTQRDIKRVLAYSTISQIGYMFLALGVGAWSAAIFHFMTHAFFKALLFLAAGAVIQAQHEEHDIFKMGGLRRMIPVTFWAFLISGCALAGLPIITAGFYSKGMILWGAWSSPQGAPALWIAGVVGVLLTSLYIFRVIFVAFFGEAQIPVEHPPRLAKNLSMVVLSVLSIGAGWINLPPYLGNKLWLNDLLYTALPKVAEKQVGWITEDWSEGIIIAAFVLGLLLAYELYLKHRGATRPLTENALGRAIHEFWYADWGFDFLYDRVFVAPVFWFAQVDKRDIIDKFYDGLAALSRACYRALSVTESGRMRWYAASIVGGTVVFVFIVLLL
ncbi:MAG TPA: NADH-quinone oxidoreductase subunit L [Terriglobales bacterium]|nr:NADH-quinone oxidoreductase subunit L [Terriglobales bacterium]